MFRCLLPPHRFLYSDEVHIGPETVMTTLYTAKKYAVPALESHCVEFLTKHLRADNAFMLLTQVTVTAALSTPKPSGINLFLVRHLGFPSFQIHRFNSSVV